MSSLATKNKEWLDIILVIDITSKTLYDLQTNLTVLLCLFFLHDKLCLCSCFDNSWVCNNIETSEMENIFNIYSGKSLLPLKRNKCKWFYFVWHRCKDWRQEFWKFFSVIKTIGYTVWMKQKSFQKVHICSLMLTY